jgi:hypothetical protein|tara:strand:- start:101 stop:388 length:288 start_codon:yes stop_codon:yes gene_type:complete
VQSKKNIGGEMKIELYRLSYEDGEYCIGTEDEIIKAHNEWVENSGRFVEKTDESLDFDGSDLIANNLVTSIEDELLHQYWEVENIYTLVIGGEKE